MSDFLIYMGKACIVVLCFVTVLYSSLAMLSVPDLDAGRAVLTFGFPMGLLAVTLGIALLFIIGVFGEIYLAYRAGKALNSHTDRKYDVYR